MHDSQVAIRVETTARWIGIARCLAVRDGHVPWLATVSDLITRHAIRIGAVRAYVHYPPFVLVSVGKRQENDFAHTHTKHIAKMCTNVEGMGDVGSGSNSAHGYRGCLDKSSLKPWRYHADATFRFMSLWRAKGEQHISTCSNVRRGVRKWGLSLLSRVSCGGGMYRGWHDISPIEIQKFGLMS